MRSVIISDKQTVYYNFIFVLGQTFALISFCLRSYLCGVVLSAFYCYRPINSVPRCIIGRPHSTSSVASSSAPNKPESSLGEWGSLTREYDTFIDCSFYL